MKTIIAIFIFLIAVCPALFAQEQIQGRLIDQSTHSPVAGATVTLQDAHHIKLSVRPSNADGKYAFPLTIGASFVKISALGYADTILTFHKNLYIEILLTPLKKQIGEVIVTAERHATAVQDVPVSVSTVKSDELISRGSFAIDDALRWVPGVSVTESEVNIRGSSGYGRGVGSRVLFLLDGMPLLAADNQDIKFDLIPMADIDRIEVVKGAGSALYGSSAIGGVINVITRVPTDTLRVAVTALAGMYDEPKYASWQVPSLTRRFASIEAGASGSINDLGILGSLALRRNEGYRLGDDSYKEDGFLKVRSPLSSSSSLSTTLLVANEDHGGWLYWKSLASPLLPSDSLEAVNGRIHSLKVNLQSSAEFLSQTVSQTVRGDLYYTKFTTDPTTVGGAEGPHSEGEDGSIEYDINSDLTPVFVSGGLVTDFKNVASDLFSNHHGVSLAAFLQGEYHVNPIILTAGLRADAIRYDANSWLTSISPKIGMTVRPDDHLSFRTSFGSGFRAPALSELFVDQVFSGFSVKPNPSLVPERSYSFELGGSYRDHYIYLDGAVFYSHLNQLIEPSFVTLGGSPFIQFENITRAEISGHEEVVEWYPFGSDLFSARVAYTYVYPHNLVTGGILEFRPRHLFQTRFATTIGKWEASCDFRYISKYESVDSILIQEVPDGDARVDAFILDARIGYNLRELLGLPVKLTFQVENLLNYYYVEIVGNLAPLRNFSLRIETVL